MITTDSGSTWVNVECRASAAENDLPCQCEDCRKWRKRQIDARYEGLLASLQRERKPT